MPIRSRSCSRRIPRWSAVPLLVLLSASLVHVVAVEAENEDFFDEVFDGSWAGTVRFGKDEFPIQVNLNDQDDAGVGSVSLADPLLGAPDVVNVLAVTSVTRKNRKIIVDVEGTDGEFEHRLALTHKARSDTLRGAFTSDDPSLSNGRVTLHRMDPDLPLQKVWVGSANVGGSKEPAMLQLIQARADDEESAVAVAVSGRGWLDGEQGPIRDGTLDGKTFTGTLQLPTLGAVALSYTLARRNTRLNGRMTGLTLAGNANLLPAGGAGKPIKFRKVRPGKVDSGQERVFTIRGANLSEGAVIHSSDPGFEIIEIDRRSKSVVRATILASGALPPGTRTDLLIVNVDGQQAVRRNALRTSGNAVISFRRQIQPVFTNSCALAGCHLGPNPQQGMELSQGEAYDNIVNVPSVEVPALDRIEPGQPNNSYLIKKIRGDADIVGARMPLIGGPLDRATIDMFISWVKQGAERN